MFNSCFSCLMVFKHQLLIFKILHLWSRQMFTSVSSPWDQFWSHRLKQISMNSSGQESSMMPGKLESPSRCADPSQSVLLTGGTTRKWRERELFMFLLFANSTYNPPTPHHPHPAPGYVLRSFSYCCLSRGEADRWAMGCRWSCWTKSFGEGEVYVYLKKKETKWFFFARCVSSLQMSR